MKEGDIATQGATKPTSKGGGAIVMFVQIYLPFINYDEF